MSDHAPTLHAVPHAPVKTDVGTLWKAAGILVAIGVALGGHQATSGRLEKLEAAQGERDKQIAQALAMADRALRAAEDGRTGQKELASKVDALTLQFAVLARDVNFIASGMEDVKSALGLPRRAVARRGGP